MRRPSTICTFSSSRSASRVATLPPPWTSIFGPGIAAKSAMKRFRTAGSSMTLPPIFTTVIFSIIRVPPAIF
jgi:hypothetical protein